MTLTNMIESHAEYIKCRALKSLGISKQFSVFELMHCFLKLVLNIIFFLCMCQNPFIALFLILFYEWDHEPQLKGNYNYYFMSLD